MASFISPSGAGIKVFISKFNAEQHTNHQVATYYKTYQGLNPVQILCL
jgi:hypothetical protein